MGHALQKQTVLPQEADVTLHIYDLGTSGAVQLLNRVLRSLNAGVFHCGVEVYDDEWSYSPTMSGKSPGIFCCEPKQCPGHTYCESIVLGSAPVSKPQALKMLERLQEDW